VIATSNTEGWLQVSELALALVLSAGIGLEREIRQKSAGLRTYTLVGVGAALFMLISKYGFSDVLSDHVVLDPSRVAAQIVTGIGFIGAGLIFVRSDAVRGLTTAAATWLTAAVGAAAGAGLPVLAAVTTVAYLVVALLFPLVTERLPRSSSAISVILVRYPDGHGILRTLLRLATDQGFAVDEISTSTVGRRWRETGVRDRFGAGSPENGEFDPTDEFVDLTLSVHGRGSVNGLAGSMSEIHGVSAVVAGDANVVDD
jgi:putative Mg2+ transporter-C (MgtC) family protein